MTKKDYIKFAAMLKQMRIAIDDVNDGMVKKTSLMTIEKIESGMMNIFAEDNQNFDFARFTSASQIEDTKATQ